jgi:hypothetical protein
MSYRFTVGEATLESEAMEQRVWIKAEVVFRTDTPFEHEEHRANWCTAGYTDFTDWSHRVGLYTLFFGFGWNYQLRENDACPVGLHREIPLIRGHGAPTMICEGDLQMIRQAMERLPTQGPISLQQDDTDYAYLVWFAWWFDWALRNCERPIFEVS